MNDTSHLKGCFIFLDIDGTLVPTGETHAAMSSELRVKIELLRENNHVRLCSNRKDHDRNRKFAEVLRVEYFPTRSKKPFRGAGGPWGTAHPPYAVIGDKFITDGLFAKRIGARFIKVPRISSAKESILIRFGFWFDHVLYCLFS